MDTRSRDPTPAGPGATIRLATRADAPAINAMRAVAGWSLEVMANAYAEMDTGKRAIYVAQADGQLVASVQLLWWSEDSELADGRAVAHLSDLVVLPGYRRRGVARQLAEHLEAEAVARGFTVMTLDVDENHAATQRLYERWGYVYFRQTLSTWGTWLNGMRKSLAQAPAPPP